MPDSKPRLLILGTPPANWLHALGTIRDLAEVETAASEQEAGERLAEAEIAFTWERAGAWVRRHFARGKKLRWIQSSSSGVEHILNEPITASDVVVTNGRGLYAQPLAEFAMFGVLFFAKRFPEMEANRQARRFKGYDVQEAASQTIGIVGLGGTGLATARLARAFGMRVLATRRRPPSGNDQKLVDGFVAPDRLNDLLAASDYVVNALPLTTETRGLFGSPEFRAMKRSGIFINVGRGKTVREDELVEALSKRTIAGAALDVFEKEPLPPESDLYALPNVILSPHCADLTGSYHGAIRNLLEENLLRYVSGQPLLNVVDKSAGY